ncbi:homeobox-leucine zipper protein ROC3-like isoform X1 [Zingiber officinale]|uniref:homeobox-leucine zipper protein ROC3-like isoform X1 n=2 Tax=Zingiber officinale TaxID=94328 RepID=UPI001C4B5F93|nr:homeobox-leucine zipper protein ROC3-like isoform X1 [Zingiber officinale]
MISPLFLFLIRDLCSLGSLIYIYIKKMYGDCQVLSSMIGGANVVVSPDSLIFSSPIQNPSGLGFMASMPPFHAFSSIMPEGMMGMSKEEEMESGSGSGPLDGGVLSCGEEHDDELMQQHPLLLPPPPQPPSQQPAAGKKKRYHRHTARQIQEMEALFKECPHPDEKQRMKLSQELGLKPRQVKFWFQNRRTQLKAQHDRADNVGLRAENESLKNENFRLQAAVRNVVCRNCGGPAILGEMSFDEQQLHIENARLKDELERLSCITSRYSGGRSPLGLAPAPLLLAPSLDLDMGVYSRHFNEPPPLEMIPVAAAPLSEDLQHSPFAGGLTVLDQDKPLLLDLAMTAADYLVRMCNAGEPLWVRKSNNVEVLDLEEHSKRLAWPMELKQHDGEFRTEASRDTAMVIMNSITLVDAFLDANKWMELFPSIVSKSRTIQVLSSGVAGGNGCLQLMHGELQFLSPLVAAREAYFFRYCQKNSEEGSWIMVDFPVDGFVEGVQTCFPWYRRRTSGCIIQDMPNGYSRVTWVEHAEVEDKPVHQVFRHFVGSGMAYGATRWASTLQRQCERLASLMARNISDLGAVIPSPEARKNMMKLSQRMVRTFCATVCATGAQSWTALSDSPDDTVRVTTRKNTEPGQPSGVILAAVSTTWLPFSHQQVFELLTDEQRRSQLDMLSSGNSSHEVAHIANGSHPRNCVSLLRVNAANNSAHSVELLLQESSTHPTGGSILVYATVDVDAVQVAMSGEDPSYIPLLPTGFVILPASDAAGCLFTVGTQVLASAVHSAKLNLSSVTAINNHLSNTVQQITSMLGGVATEQSPPAPTPEHSHA